MDRRRSVAPVPRILGAFAIALALAFGACKPDAERRADRSVHRALALSRVALTAPIADAPVALYFTVANHGAQADTLIAVDADAARTVALHGAMSDGAGMRMIEQVAVPSQGELSLHPGGMHGMLDGFTRTLRAGDSVHIGLVFRHAGRIALWAPVLSYAAIDSAFPPSRAP